MWTSLLEVMTLCGELSYRPVLYKLEVCCGSDLLRFFEEDLVE
jgi:hypothetical protein